MIGAVIGFIVGAFIGSSFGIAGMGTAIAGTLPFGLVGAYIGYRIEKGMASKPAGAGETPASSRSDGEPQPQGPWTGTTRPKSTKIEWEHVPYNDFDRGLPTHILNDGLKRGIQGTSDLSENNQGSVRMRFRNWATGRDEVEFKIHKVWVRDARPKNTHWIVEIHEIPDDRDQPVDRGCVTAWRQGKAVQLAQETVNRDFAGTVPFATCLNQIVAS